MELECGDGSDMSLSRSKSNPGASSCVEFGTPPSPYIVAPPFAGPGGKSMSGDKSRFNPSSAGGGPPWAELPRSSGLRGLPLIGSGVRSRSGPAPRLILPSAMGVAGTRDPTLWTALRGPGRFGCGIASRGAGRFGNGTASRAAGRLPRLIFPGGWGTASRAAGRLGGGIAPRATGRLG